jgi:hypothetical protein
MYRYIFTFSFQYFHSDVYILPKCEPMLRFGLHQQAAFGPWHRAYLWQVEQALFAAARRAALRFTNVDIRYRMYNIEAFKVRLCYWDWTLG